LWLWLWLLLGLNRPQGSDIALPTRCRTLGGMVQLQR
jgi:hypothetical protein